MDILKLIKERELKVEKLNKEIEELKTGQIIDIEFGEWYKSECCTIYFKPMYVNEQGLVFGIELTTDEDAMSYLDTESWVTFSTLKKMNATKIPFSTVMVEMLNHNKEVLQRYND